MNFALGFDIYWFNHSHMALFYMLFDELKYYNLVLFKLRSLKWRAEYRCSHSSPIYFKMLLAYYSDTQKQSSGEFAKFIGKQLCRSPFLSKVAGSRSIKKEAPTQCYLRTLPEDCSENWIFFYIFLWHFFTHIPEIVETFRERFIFQITELFLLFMSYLVFIPWSQGILMSPATGPNSDSIGKVFMQAWTLRKLETFYTLLLMLLLFNQDSTFFL